MRQSKTCSSSSASCVPEVERGRWVEVIPGLRDGIPCFQNNAACVAPVFEVIEEVTSRSNDMDAIEAFEGINGSVSIIEDSLSFMFTLDEVDIEQEPMVDNDRRCDTFLGEVQDDVAFQLLYAESIAHKSQYGQLEGLFEDETEVRSLNSVRSFNSQCSTMPPSDREVFFRTKLMTKSIRLEGPFEDEAEVDEVRSINSVRSLNSRCSTRLPCDREVDVNLFAVSGSRGRQAKNPIFVPKPFVPLQHDLQRAHSDSSLLPSLRPSFGSIGHPELCSRPCLFFSRGVCESGSKCKFCHFPHQARQLRFDKRNRIELFQMPISEVACAVYPVLVGRVERFQLTAELDPICKLIAKAQKGSPFACIQTRYKIRPLIRAMKLSSILKLMERQLATKQPIAYHATGTCQDYERQDFTAADHQLLAKLLEKFRTTYPDRLSSQPTRRRSQSMPLLLNPKTNHSNERFLSISQQEPLSQLFVP